MAKDTFYFSHDYNTRSDEKIKKLIRTHGMVGYGLFWGIIEDLYQNNNSLELDYDLLAYEYRVNEDIIKSIINDFSLFTNDEKTFGSVSISKRIDIRNEKSKTASDNAYKRWGKSDSRQKANDTIFYIIRMFSDDEEFIKCGITNESISRRFSGKTSGYSYEVLKQYEVELEKALELENEINSKFNNYKPLNKFGGFLECYKVEDLMQISEIAMQCECKSNPRKESKGKERKKVNKGNEGVNNNLSALPTSERENIFKQTLFPYLDMYGAEMLKAFFMYWTEKNSNGKKMRFEMEKVFDLPRRLATWKSRQKIDNGTASPQKSKSQQTYENVEGAKELIKKIYENE